MAEIVLLPEKGAFVYSVSKGNDYGIAIIQIRASEECASWYPQFVHDF